ncbi:putative F-box/kelch-repeat protein At3g24610 [Capsella rubella]|uniref:putative F-box/kelch-repeat protein At3g24610 n=1 Tax=Capsella rubella TaxID=81985 RepID=UPI000CD51FEF|nr:putative F-box/kelch-repeat protein At3g24610 [Capsella rubella]
MSNEEPPQNNNKRRRKEASPSLLESLPDELAISCLARLSRLDLAALSLVSKSCRSFVLSPELCQMRSVMGYAEKYPYICFSGSAVVALHCGIYVIGGLVNGEATSGVLLLDCRSHKWHRVTSMRVPRASPAASLVDGKIYVLGGCKDDKNSSSNWGEVFDPKTQTWDALPMPMPMLEEQEGDKVYLVDSLNRSFFYSPSQCKWGRGVQDSTKYIKRDWCAIDNLLYSCGSQGRIYCCEPEAGGLNAKDWDMVEGYPMMLLQAHLKHSRLIHSGGEMASVSESNKTPLHKSSTNLKDLLPGARAKLTNFGRNILVFWDTLVGPRHSKSLEISCAELSFVRSTGFSYNYYGRIEWSDAILTIDPLLYHPKLLYSVSVDV